MGKYGKIWENMGKYGKIWERMGTYGKIYENMVMNYRGLPYFETNP